ncbi:hypothetical protein [Streptomyces sp. KMM 9044]|uniref:hypothetical protein n=1 Tax=Streptomyces sp. KMM 9044 TaxID=2744474 RepID=UPI00215145A4|nr:hypothetical protein [Streptomyces sp. KMM 9044]WAX79167.1 hypothetical protein HUV60_017295 [Streptomyces sp. KMM 9044]
MTSWLRVTGATGAGLALRAGVVLGVMTGAGVMMPYSPVAASFGTSVAYGADGAAGGRQEVLGGPPDAPSHATTRPSSASSVPPPFRSAPASAEKPSLSPSAEPSRAGSRPGEGRKRPGREVPAAEEQSERPESPREAGKAGPWDGRDDGPGDGGRDTGDGVSGVPENPGKAHADAADTGSAPDAAQSRETSPVVPSEVSRQPAANAATGTGRSAEPMLRILPLGSGLVLMGLGLGLAFAGLRLRRS